MAENTERDYRKEVLTYLETADKGRIIAKGSNSLVSSDKARKERDSYGLDSLLKDPFKDGKPRFTKEQYEALSDEDKADMRVAGAQYRAERAMRDAGKVLSGNSDKIFKDQEGKYDSKLVQLVNSKDLMENASDANVELFRDYAQVMAYDQLAKGKGNLDDEQRLKIASAAASKTQYDETLKKGYDEKLADLAGKLASLAPSEKVTPELVKKGAEQIKKEVARKVEGKHGKDVSDKVAKAVAETLTNMLKSGNPNSESLALNLYYKSQQGYAIEERDFPDAFKEKKKAA